MKTKNNTQKTANGQVRKMAFRGSVVIFSLVLLSLTVSSQKFWNQYWTNSTYDKLAMFSNEQPSETKNNEVANNVINAEISANTNSSTINYAYEPKVEAELEAESALQMEEYNAQEFGENEMAHEIENWMNTSAVTNNGASGSEFALQVEEYYAQEFVDAEMATENEIWMNTSSVTNNEIVGAEFALQVEEYNAQKFVETEMALEIENWAANNTFLNEAEKLTASEADVKIENQGN